MTETASERSKRKRREENLIGCGKVTGIKFCLQLEKMRND